MHFTSREFVKILPHFILEMYLYSKHIINFLYDFFIAYNDIV